MKSKNTVVFIHGFQKDTYSWNYNSKNKPILIEETLAKSNNTVLIQMNQEDYMMTTTEASNKIYEQLTDYLNTKITLVTHSLGSFYALKLAELYPNTFKKLLLIDPTIKTPEYFEYISSQPLDNNKLKNYHDLPTGLTLSPKIIVRIHFDYNPDIIHKIPYYNKMTNKNTKSRLILHDNIGHMIHWKIPHVIIDSINEMIKF